MKNIEFEVAGLKIYDEAVMDIPKNGGYANLEFLSNLECVANIPASAQSWISVVPSTKSTMQYTSIQIYVSENNKSTSRSATVRVESPDGKFNGCTSLSDVNMPETITSIGESAFFLCNGLRKVTIGRNIAKIGGGAFYENPTLLEVYIKSTIPPVLYNNFYSSLNPSVGIYNETYVFHYDYQEDPKCVIYVPLYSLNLYKEDWKQYHSDFSDKTYGEIVEGYEFD